MRFILRLLFILCVVMVVSFPVFVFAQVTLSYQLPGTVTPTLANPCTTVINFYYFALFISGILAFGAIAWGGIKYSISVGNPSGQSEGIDWIEGAVLGILLLAGSYLLLNTINPALVTCQMPSIPNLNTLMSSSGNTVIPGSSNNVVPNANTGQYQSLSDAGFACKAASAQPNGQASCSAAPAMIATLQCIQNQVGAGNFIVTEAMPPTVPHQSQCHNNGCCVDVQAVSGSCADAAALVVAANACGTTAANEYAGCSGGQIYPTTTGNNVHINAAPGCN